MTVCDSCGTDTNNGLYASNDTDRIYLCPECVYKQSNGAQVGEDT